MVDLLDRKQLLQMDLFPVHLARWESGLWDFQKELSYQHLQMSISIFLWHLPLGLFQNKNTSHILQLCYYTPLILLPMAKWTEYGFENHIPFILENFLGCIVYYCPFQVFTFWKTPKRMCSTLVIGQPPSTAFCFQVIIKFFWDLVLNKENFSLLFCSQTSKSTQSEAFQKNAPL